MKTALYDQHCALGAKMVSFSGWEMPVQYKGILVEHQAVREAVGLFDVSHMGRILVNGPDAEKFLDYLSTNKIADKAPGTVTYTVWCNEKGTCVDDVLIYKQSSVDFFVIVNAGNRQQDHEHLRKHQTGFNVQIQDRFQEEGILALQGPQAEKLMEIFYPEVKKLKPMHFITQIDEEGPFVLSRTGYTGAGGFEIYASHSQIVKWWNRLLQEGKPFGIEPVGLGARDTLRLEMGFALYGHEISETIAPTESVSSWTVKWQKPNFLGKKILEELEKNGHKRFEYGVKLIDRGVAREGYPVFHKSVEIGYVTSGSFSPTLNQSIALILVQTPLQEGDQVEIQIRQNQCQAQVTQIPFVRKNA